jgi:uncharacterized integral membrane protein
LPDQKKETNWRAWMLGILATLALVVAIQNSQETTFDILFIETEAPLIVVILLSLLIGAVIGYVGPLVRRHRREERRGEEG